MRSISVYPKRLKMIILVLASSLFVFPAILISGNLNNEYPAHSPRVFSSELFPCSDCHEDMEPNPEVRELEFHLEIKIINHAEHERWCLDCHDANERDKLRLINGKKIGFENSYRLCGQCHGTIYKDWKAGIHGKRIGNWDGKKEYFLCTYCHNPHSPRFRQLSPMPAPVKPEDTI